MKGKNAYYSCASYWEGENGENRVAGSAIVGELTLTPAFDLLPHRLELHRILPSQMSMASARTEVIECLASTGVNTLALARPNPAVSGARC